MNMEIYKQLSITHLSPKLPPYRKQAVNSQPESTDWFLHDSNLGFNIHCWVLMVENTKEKEFYLDTFT